MSEGKQEDKTLMSCGCKVVPILGYSERRSCEVVFCDKHGWGHLVQKVNAYDQLVKALKNAQYMLDGTMGTAMAKESVLTEILIALKAAEEEI